MFFNFSLRFGFEDCGGAGGNELDAALDELRLLLFLSADAREDGRAGLAANGGVGLAPDGGVGLDVVVGAGLETVEGGVGGGFLAF